MSDGQVNFDMLYGTDDAIPLSTFPNCPADPEDIGGKHVGKNKNTRFDKTCNPRTVSLNS